jgi:uncharacterized protein (DUF488 family)
MTTLFLTGYEKKTLSDFLSTLKQKNITTVIDVREIPLSRKNGFSKSILARELFKNKINYYHFPELGSPTALRNNLRETNDYLTFFKEYRKYIGRRKTPIIKVIKLVVNNGENSTLLCFERNTDLCHRSIIASEILKMNKKLRIIPL